jgi:hypothetical protein
VLSRWATFWDVTRRGVRLSPPLSSDIIRRSRSLAENEAHCSVHCSKVIAWGEVLFVLLYYRSTLHLLFILVAMEKSDLRSSRFAQAILDILLPFTSLAVTILFGVYSIKSVQLAQDANKMSSNANDVANSAASISNDDARTSNILALLQICLGDTTVHL